jgi:recombination protein RecA
LQPGTQAFAASEAVPAISTSFPRLDRALDGSGGIPPGRITEILGMPTSGMITLALKIMAAAQTQGNLVAYIDLGGTFDPDYAVRCEVSLSHLLLIRPSTGREGLEIAHSLIASRTIGGLVFDSVAHLFDDPHGAQTLATTLRQFPAALAVSPCALIFLTPLQFGPAMSVDNYPSGFALPHYAAVRMLLKKEKWLRRGHDIRGYQAQVQILKNKLGRAGHKAKITITFNGVVRGDGT